MSDPDELMDGEFHPDNPVFASVRKTFCVECSGTHETSGSRFDCMKHWRKIATQNFGLVERAIALLSSATPNAKLLNEAKQREWCNDFGKWFSDAYPLIDKHVECSTVRGIIEDWLELGKYRIVMHRHDDTFRAIDQSEGKFLDCDTLESLCSDLQNWPAKSKSTSDQYLNLSQV